MRLFSDKLSHVYNYEGGGIARLAGASVKLMDGDRGRFTAADVLDAINPDDSHYANTSLVCLEDTCNKGGGAVGMKTKSPQYHRPLATMA